VHTKANCQFPDQDTQTPELEELEKKQSKMFSFFSIPFYFIWAPLKTSIFRGALYMVDGMTTV
jgi:hypothetical protein